jgi:hypothetical protein
VTWRGILLAGALLAVIGGLALILTLLTAAR